VKVTAHTPYIMGRLLAINQDMAVVTKHETSLGFVCLYFDCNMAKACKFEYLVRH
jgi:hypothetical protein